MSLFDKPAPGSTDARINGCTCRPEQIGPSYVGNSSCPMHGLAAQMADLPSEDRERLAESLKRFAEEHGDG